MASERKMPRTKSERQFRSRTQSITSNDSEQGVQSGNNGKVKVSIFEFFLIFVKAKTSNFLN